MSNINLRRIIREEIWMASLHYGGIIPHDVLYRHIFFHIVTWVKQMQVEKARQFTTVVQYAEQKKNVERGALYDGDNRDPLLDRTYDHFTKMNHFKELELLSNRKIKEETKPYYQEQPIYQYQYDEFRVLEEKFGDPDVNKAADITYKRIRSNNLHKIKFSDYQKFVEELKDIVEISNEISHNIGYYKLEKRLNFELIKTLCKVVRRLEKAKKYSPSLIPPLLKLMLLPDLVARQHYAEQYELIIFGSSDKLEGDLGQWAGKAYCHIFLLEQCIRSVQNKLVDRMEHINLVDYEDEFCKIYAKNTFSSSYSLGTDFLEKNFKLVMSAIAELNSNEWDKVVDEINKVDC